MINTKDIDWLESSEFSGLSNKGMMLCSRFARELKRIDGQILRLRDPQLPKFISQAIRSNPNPALISIFDDLITELEILAEKRGQPRYRGSVTNKNAGRSFDEPNEAQTSSQGTAKMYRGTMIMPEKKATLTAEKTKSPSGVYRGSIIK